MTLQIASINSGSNGNCYYIANEQDAVLVDVGLSCREIERRMLRMGLNMQKVKAIFITHEHIDHIRGVEGTSKKHNIPVYISEATQTGGHLQIREELVRRFDVHTAVQIGDLEVIGFSKRHDARDPYSFVVKGNEVTIGVFTDIGSVCDNVTRYFSMCHAAFLESNYCDEMLSNGRYPEFLKARIRGDHGHLSNAQALQLFLEHRSPELRAVLLSHLSKDNNSPEAALEVFAPHAGETRVGIASRFGPTEVFSINAEKVTGRFNAEEKPVQYSLF
jgi:phosphoribosyl 1,2-cyclic phosphodiesterase